MLKNAWLPRMGECRQCCANLLFIFLQIMSPLTPSMPHFNMGMCVFLSTFDGVGNISEGVICDFLREKVWDESFCNRGKSEENYHGFEWGLKIRKSFSEIVYTAKLEKPDPPYFENVILIIIPYYINKISII